MARKFVVVLAAAVIVGTGANLAAAGSTRAACPQVADASGDVARPDQDPVISAAGPWPDGPLDIISATVSSDAQSVTTTVHVAGLSAAADPVHSNMWIVRLAPKTARSGEFLYARALRLYGGDRFNVWHEYTTGRISAGPLTHVSGNRDEAPATGSVDVRRGLISVRIPFSLLEAWGIPKTAAVWDMYASSYRAVGTTAGDLRDLPMANEAHPADEASVAFAGRLNQRGCPTNEATPVRGRT
jgi:hypothetical protein